MESCKATAEPTAGSNPWPQTSLGLDQNNWQADRKPEQRGNITEKTHIMENSEHAGPFQPLQVQAPLQWSGPSVLGSVPPWEPPRRPGPVPLGSDQ